MCPQVSHWEAWGTSVLYQTQQDLHLAWQALDVRGCKASYACTFCWRCGRSTRSASFAQVLETTCPSMGAPPRCAAAPDPLAAWLGKKLIRGVATSPGMVGLTPVSRSCCSAVAMGERSTVLRGLGCNGAVPAACTVLGAGSTQILFIHLAMAAIITYNAQHCSNLFLKLMLTRSLIAPANTSAWFY